MTPSVGVFQARDSVAPWTLRQIHDTVAKIAAEPKFAEHTAASLLGRFLRFIGERISDLLDFLSGRADARWVIIAAVVVVAIIIGARITLERQTVAARRARAMHARVSRGGRTDYWTLAAEDAAAGRYAAGCHALYAAVLDTLAREGVVAFHASKTAGDYARELRRNRFARAAEYMEFIRVFDRAAFGTAEPSADDFARVRAAAASIARPRIAA